MEFASGHDVDQGPQSDLSCSGGLAGRLWVRPDQIFTDVTATVGDKFLELISDRHYDFFEKLKLETGVDLMNTENGRSVILKGNLEQIILTKMKMEKYVMEQHSWNPTDVKDDDIVPNIKIECVTSFKAEPNTTPKKPCYVGERSILADDPPTKSRRKVRAPRKLAPNSDSDCKMVIDEESLVDVMTHHRSLNGVMTSRSNDVSPENIAVGVDGLKCEEDAFPVCKMEDFSMAGESSFDSFSKDASRERLRHTSGSPFEYSCELCSFKALKEGQLLKHVLIHGKSDIIHVCDKCSFASVSFNHYTRHLLSHSESVFRCPECPFQTDEAKQLSRHVTMKHTLLKIPPINNMSSILQCSECAYNTTKIYHFERHLLVHNRDLKGLLQVYQCGECPYKTHRKEHYNRHRNNVHIRSRPYQCGYCRRSYKNLDSLREHERSSHSISTGGAGDLVSLSNLDRYIGIATSCVNSRH